MSAARSGCSVGRSQCWCPYDGTALYRLPQLQRPILTSAHNDTAYGVHVTSMFGFHFVFRDWGQMFTCVKMKPVQCASCTDLKIRTCIA